jgi:hypothetical protein
VAVSYDRDAVRGCPDHPVIHEPFGYAVTVVVSGMSPLTFERTMLLLGWGYASPALIGSGAAWRTFPTTSRTGRHDQNRTSRPAYDRADVDGPRDLCST